MPNRLAKLVDRALLIVVLVSFALPFTTVKGCSSEEVRDYSGYEQVAESGGGFLVGVLVLAVGLLVATFLRLPASEPSRALLRASKALLGAGAAYLMVFGVSLGALFDEVTPRVGFHLCLAAWVGVYALALSRAIRGLHEVAGVAERPHGRSEAIGLLLGSALFASLQWQFVPRDASPPELVRDGLGVLAVLAPVLLLVWLAILAVRWGRGDAPSLDE